MATAVPGARVVSALNIENFDSSAITYEKVNLTPIGEFEASKLAFVLRHVLSPEECTELIRLSESYKYVPALVNAADGIGVMAPGYRDGERVIIDDPEFTKILFSRISKYLPRNGPGIEDWTLNCINERLRFLKYGSGGKFEAHRDSAYIRVAGSEATLITVQIYLNGDFGHGETTFLDWTRKVRVPIVPEPGMVLVFQHDILHEGSLVTSGTKYTIRGDVLYKAPPEPEGKSWSHYSRFLKFWD